MKNCIPLLGVILCLTLLNNCTNRDEEKDFEVQKTIKNEKFTAKSNLDSTLSTHPTGDPDPPKNGDPDPPKDGDDWITKP